MRYLVEDLMRDWIDGFDVWFYVDCWSGSSFCFAWALLNEGGVCGGAGELVHKIVQRRRGCGSDFLGNLALRERPARKPWAIPDAIGDSLRFDVGDSCVWYGCGIKEVLLLVQ